LIRDQRDFQLVTAVDPIALLGRFWCPPLSLSKRRAGTRQNWRAALLVWGNSSFAPLAGRPRLLQFRSSQPQPRATVPI